MCMAILLLIYDCRPSALRLLQFLVCQGRRMSLFQRRSADSLQRGWLCVYTDGYVFQARWLDSTRPVPFLSCYGHLVSFDNHNDQFSIANDQFKFIPARFVRFLGGDFIANSVQCVCCVCVFEQLAKGEEKRFFVASRKENVLSMRPFLLVVSRPDLRGKLIECQRRAKFGNFPLHLLS